MTSNINYRDLVGISNEEFNAIAYIPNANKLSNDLYIYKVISDKEKGEQVICSFGKNGVKEIYDIKNINGNSVLCLKNDTNDFIDLNGMIPLFTIIGEIKNNKIYSEYYRQGYVYKNEMIYLKTKNLSKKEIDKLPLKDKICYIAECDFENLDYIDLDSKSLAKGIRYSTVQSIKDDISSYYGKKMMEKLDEKVIDAMVSDIFYTVDWQSPITLINEGYLDAYLEEYELNNEEFER